MGFWFEFDPENKILLARFEGRLTDELLTELYGAIRKHATETDASAGILDFSAMSELAVSTRVVHHWQIGSQPCRARPRVLALSLRHRRLRLARPACFNL
jgi:hypothetical protein